MRAWAASLLLAPSLLLAGCSDGGDRFTGEVGADGVREIEIHIGWSEDRQSQYMRPAEIRVQQDDKVRLVVSNDDDPEVDYNGAKSGRDNFHDVALDYPGACDRNPIEHEVPAGRTSTTECDGNDYFVAATKGTFRIICEVRTTPSHDALGMHATFIVE